MRFAGAMVLCSLTLVACGASAPRSATRRPAARAPNGAPPKDVVAFRLLPDGAGGLRPGTPVGANFTGVRGFVNRRDGFAITDLLQAGDGTYPVATSDGGKTWRTDGPVLHIPAAQGPAAVDQAGVAAPRTYFAWCAGCNDRIDVTPDGGKHWWAASLPGQVLSLVGTPYSPVGTSSPRAELTAIVEGPTNDPRGRGASLWVYISTNGRRWTYNRSLSAVS